MNLLDREDLLAFLPGCIRTEQASEGLALHRLTTRQVDHFHANSEPQGIRARCSAGIMLHLATDSPTIDLIGRIRPGARTYAGIDVEVDGRMLNCLRIEATDETRTWRLLDMPSGPRREICVTLPQSAIVELDSLTLSDGANVWGPAPRAQKYLAIGDSITQGMDARGPASVYTAQLSRMLDAELLNIGVGGHVYDLESLDDELPFQPDLVTVAYGTNDWNREWSREQMAQIVTRYLTRLTSTMAKDARVFVLTPIWRKTGGETKTGGTLVEFSEAIGTAAASIAGVTVIDGLTLVPHADALFADGTHPNDEGFLHYAINLKRAIERA